MIATLSASRQIQAAPTGSPGRGKGFPIEFDRPSWIRLHDSWIGRLKQCLAFILIAHSRMQHAIRPQSAATQNPLSRGARQPRYEDVVDRVSRDSRAINQLQTCDRIHQPMTEIHARVQAAEIQGSARKMNGRPLRSQRIDRRRTAVAPHAEFSDPGIVSSHAPAIDRYHSRLL